MSHDSVSMLRNLPISCPACQRANLHIPCFCDGSQLPSWFSISPSFLTVVTGFRQPQSLHGPGLPVLLEKLTDKVVAILVLALVLQLLPVVLCLARFAVH